MPQATPAKESVKAKSVSSQKVESVTETNTVKEK